MFDIQVTPARYTDMAGTPQKETKPMVYFHEIIEDDPKKTLEQGRPIARSVVFLTKLTPGDTSLNIDRPMKEKDKIEFPNEWRLFEAKRQVAIEGTALESWPLLGRTQVYEFKALNIFTVEQFVSLSDQHKQKIVGYEMMKQKALSFLKLAHDAQALEQKEKENAVFQAQIDELKAIVKKQADDIVAMDEQIKVRDEIAREAKEKRKPGRPKKVMA